MFKKLSLLVFALMLSLGSSTPNTAEANDSYSSYRTARALHIVSYPAILVGPALSIGLAIELEKDGDDDGVFDVLARAVVIGAVLFFGAALGAVSLPIHLGSALWGANALRKQGHQVSRTPVYTAWGFMGAGTLAALYGIAGGDDAFVPGLGIGLASFLVAGILSCTQWLANGKHYRNRVEPTRGIPLRLQWSARF